VMLVIWFGFGILYCYSGFGLSPKCASSVVRG
jgi:hypothetical protein